MGGLKPMFTGATIASQLLKFQRTTEEKAIEAFAYIGEETVNDAREKSAGETYNDRTGNLRSSIGYKVESNGREQTKFVESTAGDESGRGKQKGSSLLSEVKTKTNIGLTVVAGMDYALWVESMEGHSVLSGSIPTGKQIAETLKELLG